MKIKLPLQIKNILLAEIALDESVCINGWVRSRRDSKAGFSFLNIHDGSCFDGIQVVVDKGLPNYTTEVLKISTGCSVSIQGKLVASEGKGQSIEVLAQEIKVLGWVEQPEHYPVAKKRHSLEYLRTVAHLRPRTNLFNALTRVRNRCSLAIHQYFYAHNFYWVNTPIITSSDCEGAGELFRVSSLDLMNLPKTAGEIDFTADFFAKPAYLTVSGQLNVEAYCMAMSRVYTFGPTFRAENSNTSRHLAEFWMVEPEIAFADLNDDASLAEDFLQHIIAVLLNECEQEMELFNQHVAKGLIGRLEKVVDSSFVRMDYSEMISVLEKSGKRFEYPVKWGLDFQSEHERYIAEEYVNGPVIVMNYPESIKAFYMRRNDDGKTCAAMDILVPGIGEIIGGSQREERLDVLEAKMQDEQLKQELWWYRELRKYGTVPHAGFGLGFERFLNYVTGIENVRDVIPFPRVPGNSAF